MIISEPIVIDDTPTHLEDDDKLTGAYLFNEKTGEYVGAVKLTHDGREFLVTIGAERTEAEIKSWVTATIKIMLKSGRCDVQADDMYDRMQLHRQSVH